MRAEGLSAEEQERRTAAAPQEGGEQPAFGQELQVVVLGVLDAEARRPPS